MRKYIMPTFLKPIKKPQSFIDYAAIEVIAKSENPLVSEKGLRVSWAINPKRAFDKIIRIFKKAGWLVRCKKINTNKNWKHGPLYCYDIQKESKDFAFAIEVRKNYYNLSTLILDSWTS